MLTFQKLLVVLLQLNLEKTAEQISLIHSTYVVSDRQMKLFICFNKTNQNVIFNLKTIFGISSTINLEIPGLVFEKISCSSTIMSHLIFMCVYP